MHTVMETAFAALPELDAIRGETVAAPVLGAGYFDGVGVAKLGNGGLEIGARGKGLGLLGDGGAEAGLIGAGLEVFLAFGGGYRLDTAVDADLAVELLPIENEGGAGISGEFPALAAEVVGEENEAVLIEAFQEDHTGGGVAVGGCRGEGHGVGLVDAGLKGLVEPETELFDGVGVDGGGIEGLALILFADGGEVHSFILAGNMGEAPQPGESR